MLNVISIETKRLREDAIKPKYEHGVGNSGMDLYACVFSKVIDGALSKEETTEVSIGAGETVLVKTGFAMAIPVGFEGQVRPTSGNSLKTMIRVANAPGTVDAIYRGEIGVILTNTGTTPIELKQGAKVGQLVIAPVYQATLIDVEELDTTARGENGFGSTGVLNSK